MKYGASSKYAILLSYYGAPYQGLQWQPNLRIETIEKVLWEALYYSGLTRKYEARSDAHSLEFSRASRTDKGVSALRQVLSCNLRNYTPGKLLDLKKNLPNDICVHDIVPVAPGFDAWDWASHRHYSYILPTYAFAELGVSLNDACSYRIPEEHWWFVRKILMDFIGGRNFKNFTDEKKLRKEFRDGEAFERSCFRYIFDATIDKPFLYKGVEFCTVHFKGASFILHQIRKMIAVLVYLSRGIISRRYLLRNLFRTSCPTVQLTPGFPLLLRNLSYDNYNRQLALKTDGNQERVDFTPYSNEINQFETEIITKNILDIHLQRHQMLECCETIFRLTDLCLKENMKYRTWRNDYIFEAPQVLSVNYKFERY